MREGVSMTFDIQTYIVPILAICALIGVQIYFSLNSNKKLGYVLPSILFVFTTLWLALFLIVGFTSMEEYVKLTEVLLVYLVVNTPTLLFLLIDFIIKRVKR